MELSGCPSVSVSRVSSVGALWEGGFAFKVQIFSHRFGSGGEEAGMGGDPKRTPNLRHKLRNYFLNVPKSIFGRRIRAKSVAKSIARSIDR